MSEIQRYMYARDGMVPDAEHLRGSGEPEFWVRFTDHEAERAENLATIDFLNKELRSAVDALADAEARIEGLVHKEQGFDNADMEYGYGRGLAESIRALAALTQPQTEKKCACVGPENALKPDEWHSPTCGGGAATAAGVADADLEAAAMEISVKATRLDPETYKVPDKLIWMLRSALFPNEDMERIKSPGPYAKAFRGRFPVPEFPGIKNRQEDQA